MAKHHSHWVLQLTRQPVPHLNQAARRQFYRQVEVENIHDLRKRGAQAVVQPCAQNQGPVAQGGVGDGLGHGRLDFLFAVRAPIPVDGMLGYFRFEILGDVFGIALTRLCAAVEFAAAIRARLRTMFDAPVDTLGHIPAAAKVSFFASRLLPASRRCGGLLIRRLHPRWGRGRLVRGSCGLRLLLGELLGQCQQGKDNRPIALDVDGTGFLLRQGCAQRYIKGQGIHKPCSEYNILYS